MSERLAFYLGVGQRQEPVLVDAFRANLAVEGFDEAIVGRLSRPREVECDTVRISPKVECLTDELWPVVDANGLRHAVLDADALKGGDHIGACVTSPNIDRRRYA